MSSVADTDVHLPLLRAPILINGDQGKFIRLIASRH